jgi:solute carrier family 25 phosphate transporter 3
VDTRLAEKSFLSAARSIVEEEGFGALWAGLGPTYWGYLLEGAVKFGVYEVLKPAMTSWLSKMAAATSVSVLNSQLLAFVLSGAVSGFAASLVLCPMEALRIRLVAEPDFASGGWIQGGFEILQNEGVQGFVKGLNPMILKQVPYTVTKNVSFDFITRMFYSMLRQAGLAISGTTTFVIPLLAAAIASILSSISSQPGDMILSLVNAHEGDLKTRDVWKSIMKSDRGIRGFFVGFKARLLHVGLTVTIQLLIYDYIKRLCGIAATGSC